MFVVKVSKSPHTQNTRQTIVNACGNSLIFSVADPDTATFLSNKIGDVEIAEAEESRSISIFSSSLSLVKHRKTQKLVLSSEIQNLKDFECFLKVSNYDLTKLKLAFKAYPIETQPISIRDDLKLDKPVPAE